MKLNLVRSIYTNESTIGKLFINGIEYCYTLEDKVIGKDNIKVFGKTAIPEGNYEITYRNEGGMIEDYKVRYADINNARGMLWIRNVPGYEFIYLHIGNTSEDTNGCILLGASRANDFIGSSTVAYKKVYLAVASELDKGNKVYIVIERF